MATVSGARRLQKRTAREKNKATDDALTTAEASDWASQHVGYNVTPSNITYLVNYGLIPAAPGSNGELRVSKNELLSYYEHRNGHREKTFKRELGADIDWRLSFEQYKESETTKHVHRLHPYKGKFIPQLVEYFLDSHTDDAKTDPVFARGDVILDPFCGSGTTLVQANELGMHAVGVDVSQFNAMISNLKLAEVDLVALEESAAKVAAAIETDKLGQRARQFEEALLGELSEFNAVNFPRGKFRRDVRSGTIDEDSYGAAKQLEFLHRYYSLADEYGVSQSIPENADNFMESWYHKSELSEIHAAEATIASIENTAIQDILRLILSRTIRSCRATTHSDLATLIKPVTETYYCGKHSQICKPLFSILSWWNRYSKDTIKRLTQFADLRTDTRQFCLTGDSRTLDISEELKQAAPKLARTIKEQGVAGIFSSPPYVGMIDYHEQHAYAYELFGLPRNDDAEIGPLSGGRGKAARDAYVQGIADVLLNCRQVMRDDYDVFLVANDKFGLYPLIAEQAGMEIVKEYRRPVLNRAEGDKGVYGESIFHMKERNLLNA